MLCWWPVVFYRNTWIANTCYLSFWRLAQSTLIIKTERRLNALSLCEFTWSAFPEVLSTYLYISLRMPRQWIFPSSRWPVWCGRRWRTWSHRFRKDTARDLKVQGKSSSYTSHSKRCLSGLPHTPSCLGIRYPGRFLKEKGNTKKMWNVHLLKIIVCNPLGA